MGTLFQLIMLISSSAREMKSQDSQPMLSISSAKSIRGTVAASEFRSQEAAPEENDQEESNSVLVIQPEASSEADGNIFKCPICGARWV